MQKQFDESDKSTEYAVEIGGRSNVIPVRDDADVASLHRRGELELSDRRTPARPTVTVSTQPSAVGAA
jgi:hypothetical protein